MCGRYTYRFTWSQIHEQLSGFGLALEDATLAMAGPAARYNVAPTSDVPVLVVRGKAMGPLSAAMMRWWLVPHWAQEASTKYPMFNARSETAATKPAFRGPMKYRRCVLPASGFYEWKKIDDKTKQPHYITRADGEPLLLAGLWDCWRDELESCTILTTSPNAEMATLHDRMPCVLEPGEVAAWVDPEQQDSKQAAGLLRPAPDGLLEIRRVSKRVGNARVDEPSLIEPAQD
ncbi:MAG: SOS response-associated peptidase [Phycisphaerales bacterium]